MHGFVQSSATLKDLLVFNAQSRLDDVAIVFADRDYSYRDVLDRSSSLASWLVARGVGPGVIVPIAFERSVEMIVSMLAVILAGGAYLPIDVDSPVARINDILADSGATDMLTTASIAGNLSFHRDVTVHRIDTDAVLAEIALHDAVVPQNGDLIRPLTADDPPYVIYTSGTTGKPKGVVNTHAGVVNSLRWMADALKLEPGDRCLLKAPYTFDLSVWEIFVPLTAGGCLVIAEPGGHRNPNYIADLIVRQRVTLTYFVPTMLSELLLCDELRATAPLRHCVAIGEALTGYLQKQFFDRLPHATLWNSYGPTEAAVGVTLWRCQPEDGDKAPPLGFPAWHTNLYVLDAKLQPAAVGETGEIFISGIQVAAGYLAQPTLTREKFLPCPFEPAPTRMYRTGDFARLREDGQILFDGRQDGQVKLNGIRVELSEIEAAIASLAGVARAVVTMRTVQGTTMLVAYLVMREGVAPMKSSDLAEGLVGLLPGYMVPSAVVTVDALPLTTSGKLDTKALPEPTFERTTRYRKPADGLEAELAALFTDLTGISPVGPDDSFFALGGTSLMAMRLAVRLKARTGLSLPMRALVETPTPAGLAAALARPAAVDAAAGNRKTVIMFPGAGGDDLQYAMLVKQCAPALDLRTIPYPEWRALCRSGARFEDIVAHMAMIVETMVPAPQPILVAGYSLGGDVAFSVAHRLEAAGREIGFLGLIDTDAAGPGPGPKRSTTRLQRASALWRNGRLGRRLHDETLNRVPRAWLPALASVSREITKSDDVEFQMSKRVMVGLRRSWRGPGGSEAPGRKLNAPTVLFQSEPMPHYSVRYDGWPERCSHLRVVPVKGDHLTMLNPEYLDAFAASFMAAVREAAERTGPKALIA